MYLRKLITCKRYLDKNSTSQKNVKAKWVSNLEKVY